MNYILFDGFRRVNFLPLVFTRPVADLRIGILTLREKWEYFLQEKTSSLTEDYLTKKFPIVKTEDNILINASVIPTAELVKEIKELEHGESLSKDEYIIAMRLNQEDLENVSSDDIFFDHQTDLNLIKLNNSWDLFYKNDEALRADFELLTKGRKSAPLSKTNFVRGNVSDIFLEKGAIVEHAFLNAESGPIYIGKEAEVMEGSKIRGPFALCEHAQLKMDAKIYGATTIGPYCKVGGEVHNSVLLGYSSKAHDGFLGHAVIGEWCNLGADTNNSNLKNTYDMVKIWSYEEESFVDTGLQFCGLIMGDHSKSGINTMFNTGSVVGVSCNLFGAGFQRNFIPSFSWGSPQSMTHFNLDKAFNVVKAVLKRRNKSLDQTDIDILTHLYDVTFKKTAY